MEKKSYTNVKFVRSRVNFFKMRPRLLISNILSYVYGLPELSSHSDNLIAPLNSSRELDIGVICINRSV